MKEEIRNDTSINSRLKYVDEKDKKLVDFILTYCFKDEQEIYTNGIVLVPVFRVLDAIIQKGENYTEQ